MQGERQRQAGWASEPAWVVIGIVLAVLAATAFLWSSRDGEFPAVSSSDEFVTAARDVWDCDPVSSTDDYASADCLLNGVPVVTEWHSDAQASDMYRRELSATDCFYTNGEVLVHPMSQPPGDADVARIAGVISGWAVNGPCWSESNQQLAP